MTKKHVILAVAALCAVACVIIITVIFGRSSTNVASPKDLDILFDVLEVVLQDSEERWEGTLSRVNREIVLEGESQRLGHLRVGVEMGGQRLTTDRGRARFQYAVAQLHNRCGRLNVVARKSPEGVSSITVAGFKRSVFPWARTVDGVMTSVKLPDEESWDASGRTR